MAVFLRLRVERLGLNLVKTTHIMRIKTGASNHMKEASTMRLDLPCPLKREEVIPNTGNHSVHLIKSCDEQYHCYVGRASKARRQRPLNASRGCLAWQQSHHRKQHQSSTKAAALPCNSRRARRNVAGPTGVITFRWWEHEEAGGSNTF